MSIAQLFKFSRFLLLGLGLSGNLLAQSGAKDKVSGISLLEAACDVITIELDSEPFCLGNGLYTVCFILRGENLPDNFDKGKIAINGKLYPATSYSQAEDSAVLCVSRIPANGSNNDVFIQVLPGCSFYARGLFTAPRSCSGNGDGEIKENVPCNITGMLPGRSWCDGTDTYSQEIIIHYEGAPESGFLALELKREWTYHSITGSPQTILITGLPGDGQYVNAFAKFSHENSCSWYARNIYRAPETCGNLRKANFQEAFRIFPNPANGKVYLQTQGLESRELKVVILNSHGQGVAQRTIQANQAIELNTSQLAAGLYSIKVIGEDFQQWAKLLINH